MSRCFSPEFPKEQIFVCLALPRTEQILLMSASSYSRNFKSSQRQLARLMLGWFRFNASYTAKYLYLFFFLFLLLPWSNFRNRNQGQVISLWLCLEVSKVGWRFISVWLFESKALKKHHNYGKDGRISVRLCSEVSKMLGEDWDVQCLCPEAIGMMRNYSTTPYIFFSVPPVQIRCRQSYASLILSKSLKWESLLACLPVFV